jgi:hypothetical protein
MLANRILKSRSLIFCDAVPSFRTSGLLIKNRDSNRNVIARPSSAPPLYSCVILNKVNLDMPRTVLTTSDRKGDLKNKFNKAAKRKTFMV